jgi:hypothetical protein
LVGPSAAPDCRDQRFALACKQGEGGGRLTDVAEEAFRGDVGAVQKSSWGAIMIASEQDLAALCGALIGNVRLPAAERQLVRRSITFSAQALKTVRASIRAGEDPLGEAFCRIRSQELRRGLGATYTPKAIVDVMTAWAADQAAPPHRVVDPGTGSGRFIAAAAKAFPKAALVAVEIDPLGALMTRAAAAVLGFSKRLTVERIDYRELILPMIEGPTLCIGNPPYVRHHDIQPEWKRWFTNTARAYGFTASGLAGLPVHFFMKTGRLAQPGDFVAFITAAEWLDVNYGRVLRKMLANGLGGTALHVIDPKALPFSGTFTTGQLRVFALVGERVGLLCAPSTPSISWRPCLVVVVSTGARSNQRRAGLRFFARPRLPVPARLNLASCSVCIAARSPDVMRFGSPANTRPS